MTIAQFFEVQAKQGQVEQYLDLAASLRPALSEMGGCLFIDRFKSLTRDNLLLSYQIWLDEAAMTAWRVHAGHHSIQEIGRDSVFADYRIRIAQVIYEARPAAPVWRPERLTPYNDPQRRRPTFVLAAESASERLPVETHWQRDTFHSVYRPGVFAHLVDLPDAHAGVEFGNQLFADKAVEYFRVFEVMRDYGMYERAEAPQYYPPAKR